FTGTTLKLTATASTLVGSSTLTITAISGALSAQSTIALTITAAPGFKLSSSTAGVSVSPGHTGTATITVASQAGFTGMVALTATGLPSGVTAAFSPAPTAATSIMTLT